MARWLVTMSARPSRRPAVLYANGAYNSYYYTNAADKVAKSDYVGNSGDTENASRNDDMVEGARSIGLVVMHLYVLRALQNMAYRHTKMKLCT